MERSILKAYKGLNVWYRRFLHFVKMLHSIPLFTPVEKTEVVCTRNTQNILSIVMGKNLVSIMIYSLLVFSTGINFEGRKIYGAEKSQGLAIITRV